jgi:hypothetical protein
MSRCAPSPIPLRARGFSTKGRIRLPELKLTEELAKRIQRIYITACGTAAYAGMVGKYLIEKIARVPVEVVIGSEFRYSDPILDENTFVLAISQSGETADTLAAMEEGRRKGACHLEHRQRHRFASHAHRGWIHLDANGTRDRRRFDQSLSPPLWLTSTCWPSCWQTCAARSTTKPAASSSPTCASSRPGQAAHWNAKRNGKRCPHLEGHPRLPVPWARHQHAHRLRRRA